MVAFAAAWLCALAGAQAVVGGSPVGADDRRFDAVGLVITNQPWAACGGWISGSCTLVGPDLVLLARHSVEDAQRRLPADGAQTHKIRFRRGVNGTVNNHYGAGPSVDCSGGFQEIFVQRFLPNPAPGADMVMGVLEHAPGGIAPMPVQISHEVTAGEPIVLAGWGFDGSCLNTGEAWTLRSKSGVLAPQTYSAWCCFEYNAASFTGVNCFTTPPGSNWVIGNMHDSGAPLLSPDPQDPQTLRLVGMAVGVTSAMKVSAWNDGGGMPALADTPARRCPADLNGDGRTDVNDLFMLVSRVLNGDPLGDVDGNSAITPNDLFVYLGWYFGGC